MNTEEKARAYDEALEDIRAIYPNLKGDAKLAVEHAFPELAESEDEMVINELQAFLASYGADYFGTGRWQKFEDWLEKQKEQNSEPFSCSHENGDSEKPNNQLNKEDEIIRESIESIIRVYEKTQGEWIGGYDTDTLVVHLREAFSALEKQKDLDKMIVVSPEVWDNAIADAYENGKVDSEKQKEQKPVETSNTDLDTKVNDWVGYMLNDNAQSYSRKNVQILLDNCARFFYDYAVMCLDKPAEWSEEDEKMIDDIIRLLPKMAEAEDNILPEILPSVARKYAERLKSIRPSWKPSEEQIYSLGTVVKGYDNVTVGSIGYNLKELYEQLKKLM